MEIRKGPYGHYVVERIGSMDNLCEYSREIISENILEQMLPVYINPSSQGYELYYDYSGLEVLKDKKPSNLEEINQLRLSLGDLLLTFSQLPDYLLSPSLLILDEKYLFTDNEYKKLRVCFTPIKTTPDNLSLNSLSDAGIRSLLESDMLCDVIKPDEIDKFIYALQTNDEDLFVSCVNSLSMPIKDNNVQFELLKSYDFFRCLLATFASLIFALFEFTAPSLILVFISIILGIKTKIQINMKKNSSSIDEDDNDTKTKMLFSDNTYGDVLSCLILTSTDANGNAISKSIYTEKATIGSDRFLCDIFVDDIMISPIHSEIRNNGNTFYIRDLSADNTTYLDNIRLEAQRNYEIKSGQTLTCGRTDFKIEIS